MFKSLKPTYFAGLLAVSAFVVPLTVQAKEPAPKAVTSAAPLMWVVKDADSTIYLLGSIHVLKPDMKWQDARITKAFAASDDLWLEIANMDDQQAAGAAFLRNALNPKANLTEGMTAADIKKLEAALTKHGIPMASAQNLKPWAVGLLITVKAMMAAGYDPNLGVDKVFLTQARAAKKPVKGFETIEQQMGFFGSFDDETSRQFLKDVLDQEEEGKALMDKMLKAWAEGDEATMSVIFVDEMKVKTPKLYDVLLKGRNEAWVPQIEQILADKGTSFVVVGTAHLIGPDGVPALLKKEGIKVGPVTK